MTRSLPLVLLALALAVPLAARADDASAGTPSKPSEKEPETQPGPAAPSRLEDKIRPVSGHLFLKQGRVELSPTAGFSVADAFFQKYSLGMKLAYHFTEALSLGAHAAYALDTPSGSIQVCRDGSCRTPKLSDLRDVPGRIGALAGVEVGWAPIYGKLNVLGEKVLHFDLGVVGGITAIQYQAPGGKETMTVGGHVGIGQRYFLSPDITLRVELRDYVYRARITQLGTTDHKLENQLMFELGVSFFLGSGPREQ